MTLKSVVEEKPNLSEKQDNEEIVFLVKGCQKDGYTAEAFIGKKIVTKASDIEILKKNAESLLNDEYNITNHPKNIRFIKFDIMNNINEKLTFTVPLTFDMLEKARNFSQQQSNQDKAEQVRRNSIAVSALVYYCDLMEVPTNLTNSDSYNIVMQTLSDVADLEILGRGKLECRPVLPNAEFCRIPQDVWEDRIGYVFVEIDEDQLEAKILGFLKEVNREQILVSQLHSLEELIYCLYNVEVEDEKVVDKQEPVWNILTQWFESIFNNNWQPEERALTLGIRAIDTEQPEVNGAKVIRLGMQMSEETVVLILRQKQLSEEEIEINLRLYPGTETMYLPTGVKLTVLDETGNPIPNLEAEARADNWLQLEFTGEPNDKFIVKVALGEHYVVEHFII